MNKEVLILSCVFPPEPVVSSQTSEQVTCDLVSRRHTVTVLTSFPSRPGGKIYPGFRRVLFARQDHPDGYKLIRCFSIPSAESSAASRFLENLVYGLSSATLLAVLPRPDVIYSNTWPVFASGLMTLVACLRRIPYVVSVQDVYPESFISQGRSASGSLVARIMRAIDRQVARRAAHIVVISGTFANIYHKDRGVSRERISVIPNWAEDEGEPASPEEAATLRDRFAIPPDSFLASYGGNIGVAAGVETFVKAFQYLGRDVYGLIAGGGSQLAACEKLAAEIAPQQVSFFNPWPAEQTMPFYRAADVLILPTQGSQSMASVPSKMIRYMLSGRPIIASGLPDSDLANLIKSSQCGWIIPPNDPCALAEKIQEVKSFSDAERQKRGESGRRYSLENLTSHACLPKVIHIIEKAAQ